MSRAGRYLLGEVAVLARIAGRYDPCWPLFVVGRGCSGPYRWPLWPVLAVMCRPAWLFWPVSLALMARIGRYLSSGVAVLARIAGRMTRTGRCLPSGVAALARIAGRYDPYWPLFAVRSGRSGPYRLPL